MNQRESENVVAIILEPMPGNGTLPPKEGYLKGVRELADRHGVLLILDDRLHSAGVTA